MKRYKFPIEKIKQLTKNIVILVDSREKKNSHILSFLDKQGISYQVGALEYGDYSFMIPASAAGEDIYFHRDCIVERKASLEELSCNLAQERDRFEKEFFRAKNDNAKIYLMVEDMGGYSSIISHKYNTKFSPAAFAASLKTFEMRFGANVQFIDQQYAGYYIVSTFQYYAREVLK